MSAIIIRDEIVHYEVLGKGRPVILLHSWIGSWRYWLPTMQALSHAYRTYAIDLWGFGDTNKSPARYLLDQQAALINDFMNTLGIPKIALVGHGLGALVAYRFAMNNPNLVDRMATICLPLNYEQVNPLLLKANIQELSSWMLTDSPDSEAARIEAPKADPEAIIRSLNDFNSIYSLDIMTQINIPTLLVYGEEDNAVTATTETYLDNLPDHIHYINLEECGHFPMLEQSSKFNRLMIDFLSLQSGESPRNLQLKEEWKRRVR